MVAEVIVDIGHSNVDRIFEYLVPEGMRLGAGMHVLVPFGMGNRTTEGFVVGVSETSAYPPEKLKPVIRLLESYSIFTAEQLEIARWLKEECHCLLVDALRLMIPAQMRGGRVREKTIRTAALALEAEEVPVALASLQTAAGTCRAPVQKAVLELLSGSDCPIAVHDLNAMIPGAAGALSAMGKKGWVQVGDQGVFRKPYQALSQKQTPPDPTEAQRSVIDAVTAELGRGENFLLRGVTGSGKTEVYLRCIQRCMELGKTAIMLVPEISLTPQTVERFRGRFGDRVAVLHSRLSYGERFDEWRRIRLGKVQVVVGARSAVFAPFENLGLIVIDEEHESSYASDKTPRYDAREVAKKRCELSGGVLLMGSATPSLESYFRAQQGEYRLLTLKQRVNRQPLPAVQVVDMRQELAEGNRSIFSAPLYRALRKCLEKGQQAILFLNRRGYSTFVSCRGCGEVIRCPQCDVSLTYHKSDQTLRCHYCGQSRPLPPVCPHCGKPFLKYFGVGTQQVEEAVNRFFPTARVVRMDYDTTQKKDAHLNLLTTFAEHRADILIGTQMIAKGLDFPQVTVVGVVAADATLHVPDFRSAERAFQLLTQVAGRAGRDEAAGRVIVQTYTPEHPSIRFAAAHDYEGFYRYEIGERKKGEFPPYGDFARFLFCGEDDPALEKESEAFCEALRSLLLRFMEEQGVDPDALIYLCACPAPLQYIKGEFRRQVLVKIRRGEGEEAGRASKKLLDLMGAFARSWEGPSQPHFEVNPQNML